MHHSKDKSNPPSQSKSVVKTPSTAGEVRPAHEEMHPSKVRHSTTKQPDSGLILGFNPVRRDSNGNIIKDTVVSNTPSKKTKESPPSTLSTPKFDLKFASDETQLSEEARKLMENVREDVARIKAQMILEKGEQERKEREAQQQQLQDGRKIAKPKGKTGRFSAAHMAEFRKMDSIEGHPSAFRATPGRFKPVDKSLKRKISKTALDEPEKKSSSSPSKPAVADAKRVKRAEGEDASVARPRTEDESPRKSAIPQPKFTIRSSSLMTPTKASSARFATAKPQKTSMIPTLARSPASHIAAPPRTPQTEFNPKLKKNLPSLGNLKSILRRHQPLFSNDPVKIAAGTHVPKPGFNPDIKLDNLPSMSFDEEPCPTPSPKKHVEFSPSTKASPSPSNIPAPEVSTSDVVYPTLPQTTPTPPKKIDTPTIRRVRESGVSAQASPFPNLPAVPHGIANKKRHRDDDDKDAENIPPADAASDEQRSAKRVKTSTPAVSQTASSPLKSRTPVNAKAAAKATPGKAAPEKTAPEKTGTPGTASRKSRGVLSMSRLNMLAKPKTRR